MFRHSLRNQQVTADSVIPEKAGIQTADRTENRLKRLDSGFRGNEEKTKIGSIYQPVFNPQPLTMSVTDAREASAPNPQARSAKQSLQSSAPKTGLLR